MKTMLLLFPHPDDESFSVGGTVAKYVKNGWTVHLILATNGEKGQSGFFSWAQGDALGALRQEETRHAANILGISDVQFLGLPDGGLSTLTPGTLEDPFFKAMLHFLPDIVITFDGTGITGHPDHIKVSYAATFAFQKYAGYLEQLKNPAFYTRGRGKPWKEEEYLRAFGDTRLLKEPKLYYVCLPASSVAFLQKAKQIPEVSFGKPWKGVPDKTITTVIDITHFKLLKGKALLSHATQLQNVDQFISFAKNPELERECFILRLHGIYEIFMGKRDRVSDRL